MWASISQRIQTMGTKTMFSLKTIFSTKKVVIRWVVGLHVGMIAWIVAYQKGKWNEFKTRQTGIFAQSEVPFFLRSLLYHSFAKRYNVDLDEVELPLKDYENFCEFFTRKINRGPPEEAPNSISSPCDGKVLSFGQVQSDECHIIKGNNYSLTELFLGLKQKEIEPLHTYIRKNPQSKLYQIILYLSPGDYHRFHAPTHMTIFKEKSIEGGYEPVNEKSILRGLRVYETNARKCLFSQWKQGILAMAFVGALNVSKIHLINKTELNRADELGYFNLGSTIVMLVESKGLKEWKIKEGDKVKYGEPLFEYIQ